MRAPAGNRKDYVHFSPHTTRWMDNDVYGHLNNVVHYALFDATVNGWLIAQGLLDPLKSGAIGVVAETGCRYHEQMNFPQIITAGMKVARIGTSSVRYEVGLFSGKNEIAAAEGFFVHVYVDASSRRPCGIPETVRKMLGSLMR